MKNSYRPSLMLTALQQERDTILAALNMKPEKLKADLAAVERLIAIYQPRAAESAQNGQPTAIKKAAKLRADIHTNGNGAQPPTPHKGSLTLPVLQAVATKSVPAQTLIDLIVAKGMNAKGLGAFVATKLVARSEKGIYSITAKGKQRLKALTAPPKHHPTRHPWTADQHKKFRATMKAKNTNAEQATPQP